MPEPPPRDDPAGADDSRLRRLTLGGAEVDRWVADRDGIRRWKPVIAELRVLALPDGGVQLDGTGMPPHRLDPAMRRHIAGLILPDDWRAILEQAGAL